MLLIVRVFSWAPKRWPKVTDAIAKQQNGTEIRTSEFHVSSDNGDSHEHRYDVRTALSELPSKIVAGVSFNSSCTGIEPELSPKGQGEQRYTVIHSPNG